MIPIPSEIPNAPNLDDVPHYIKISKTVESLIGQNEDLMARLKVNIRQNTLLEAQLQDEVRSTREYKTLNSKMSSQIEILLEKENLIRGKLEAQDLELEKIRETLNHSNMTMHQVSILKSYQRRVRTWVRKFITKMHFQIKMLKQKNLELENDVVEQQKKLIAAKNRMNEAVHSLQVKEREHQKNKIQLIEDFETRTYDLSKENQNFANENNALKSKLQGYFEMQKQLSNVHGRALSLETQLEELRTVSGKQISDLTESQIKFMTQSEMTKLQIENFEKRNSEIEAQNRVLTAKNHEAMSRHDAMNVLWSETQIQRAQLQLKNEAIVKLNQDLSYKLKEQRKIMTGAEILTKKEREAQLQNIKDIENLMADLEKSVLGSSDSVSKT